MSINSNPVRGTRDYSPEEMRVRDAMQDIILKTYLNNGFQKVQTPILEDIGRIDKSEGGENLNMIFRILKRGQKLDLTKEDLTEKDLVDLGLRFDLTVPLTRYFANNRNKLRIPFKVIQIGEVFRAERPQKGRLREFYQCDIDIIGEGEGKGELELIHTAAKALRALGFEEFSVRLNDRRILFDLIEGAGFDRDEVMGVCITFDKLDKIGVDGVREELIEKGYETSLIDNFMEIASDGNVALKDIEKLCKDGEAVRELSTIIEDAKVLSEGKYDIIFDKSLVRGMGYYTGTIFEIESPHFKGAIAGGGRYDKMIGKYIGEDYPAVGISIGFERIAEILLNNQEISFSTGNKRLALLYDKEDRFVDVIKKGDELRDLDYDVALIGRSGKMGRQLNALEKEGFEAACIYGEEGIKHF
ncbi:MAG: histidine--tRNA ligase [Anaerovoracaceae bacterium]